MDICGACRLLPTDAVVFAGNGCTGAVDVLVRVLDLAQRRPKARVAYSCRFPGCSHSFSDSGDYKVRAESEGERRGGEE